MLFRSDFCSQFDLMGKILVAKEGINGSISGSQEVTEKYKEFLRSQPGFEDIVFKEEWGVSHPFTKFVARVRKEIVALKKDVDIKKAGKYLSPTEFLDLVEGNEDILLLDTRNDYEYKVGKFKHAINPKIRTFREFPAFVESIKEQIGRAHV